MYAARRGLKTFDNQHGSNNFAREPRERELTRRSWRVRFTTSVVSLYQ